VTTEAQGRVDVLGIGVNSIDRVIRLSCTAREMLDTGKVRVPEEELSCGGQTATAMAACAALGLRAAYLGTFGSDEHAQRISGELRSRGVDVSRCSARDVQNAGATVLLDVSGARTVLWHRDERLRLDARDVSPEAIDSARLVHVDDVDDDAALAAARLARERGVQCTSDIEQAKDRTPELVAAVQMPIFDHNAPVQLTGEHDPERALRKLRKWNPGVLVMTLGPQGAAALDGDEFLLSPALSVPVLDTTGAGDVFRAGVIYGLLQGWPLETQLRFANAAAAASCTRFGAISSVPSLADVRAVTS